MMNNCWYVDKSEITFNGENNDIPSLMFRHSIEPGIGEGCWMKPSVENLIVSAKQAAGAPQKQFTREEIEKHDFDSDCWIIVGGQVYDATSVISWHPGDKAPITSQAAEAHQETSDGFSSIYDDFAYQKLKECAIGVVTEEAAHYMKRSAEAVAREKAEAARNKSGGVTRQKHKWVSVILDSRESISDDTRKYVFYLPEGSNDTA